jgi:hypothetical protein
MAFVAGSSMGQFLGDVSFDGFASYTPALIGYAVALIIGAVLVNCLGPYVYLAERRVGPDLGSRPIEVV